MEESKPAVEESNPAVANSNISRNPDNYYYALLQGRALLEIHEGREIKVTFIDDNGNPKADSTLFWTLPLQATFLEVLVGFDLSQLDLDTIKRKFTHPHLQVIRTEENQSFMNPVPPPLIGVNMVKS